MVVTSEDLRHDRRAVMQRVYDFIEVDPTLLPPELDREFYRTQDKPVRSVVPLRVRKSFKRNFPATKRFKELEANVVRNFRRAGGKDGDADSAAAFTMLDETRQRLQLALADDVRRLRSYLGTGFDGWGIA